MKLRIRSSEIFTAVSCAYIAFTLCSLQFYEVDKISHRAWMETFEVGIRAPENLPGVLERLERTERRFIRTESEQPLTQSKEWAEARESLEQYSRALQVKNAFHDDVSRKLSAINLRNTSIGLVLVLGYVAALLVSCVNGGGRSPGSLVSRFRRSQA